MILDPIARLERDEQATKPRETRTRRTRTWQRRILLAVLGIGAAMFARRLRRRMRGSPSSTEGEPIADAETETSTDTSRETPTTDQARETATADRAGERPTGGGRRSPVRRLGALVASAVAVAALRRLLGSSKR